MEERFVSAGLRQGFEPSSGVHFCPRDQLLHLTTRCHSE